MRFTAAMGPSFYGPDKPTAERYRQWTDKQVELRRKDGRAITVTIVNVWVDEGYGAVYATFDAAGYDPDHTAVRQLAEMINER